MTPVRAPDVVRGDVPGLLCRGMPVLWRGESFTLTHQPPVVDECQDGWNCRSVTSERRLYPLYVTVDWSDRAAIYLCLAWLADRGHACTWMLPTTHGGRVEAWDGLSAWEVSAIIVARSVGRVAQGDGPISDVLGMWWMPCAHNPDTGATWVRSRIADPKRKGGGLWACEYLQPWRPFAWECSLVADPQQPWTWLGGPETGDEGKLAADRAALADGCAILDPSGILLPD